MASTRNKNTPGNFCLDHRQNVQIEAWQLYKNGGNGYAYDTRLAAEVSILANCLGTRCRIIRLILSRSCLVLIQPI